MTGMADGTYTTVVFDQLVWPKLMFAVKEVFSFEYSNGSSHSVSVSIFDMIIAHLLLLLFANCDWQCHAIRLPKNSRI